MKKAFDQTVRDLKREVNKKVLKVPGIEQKILDATSNEPWGPHGSLLADIANASRNHHEYQIIMHVLWKRLNDIGKNWRHVYKALTVLEYLVGHGTERVIDDIREHAYQISTLSDFQYIDSSGRDQGNNVRRKSQSLVALVNDKEKVKEVREKAMLNKNKYRSTFSTSGRGGGGYGGRYDDDRYEGQHRDGYESRYKDDDRNAYGRERDWGSKDDERYGRGSSPYNRDGNSYGRDSDDQYGRDGYRDDDYRGSRSNDDSFGPRNRSFDRDRDRFSEEDDRYSSRNSAGRRDEPSQEGRSFDHKLSEQSPTPSYEEAVKNSHDQVRNGSNGNLVPSTKAYSPPVDKSSPPTGTTQYSNQSATAIHNSIPNKESDQFDEFDPRGSAPVAPAPAHASGPEIDLFSNQSALDSVNSLALVPMGFDTASEADALDQSGARAGFVPLSSAATAFSQPPEDPFGDGPFKATRTEGDFNTPATSVQTSQPPAAAAPTFDFGDTLRGLTYSPNTMDGSNIAYQQHFTPNPPPPITTNDYSMPQPQQSFQQPQQQQQSFPQQQSFQQPQQSFQQPSLQQQHGYQGNMYNAPNFSYVPPQPASSAPPSQQVSHAATTQPTKGKFETKSTVWADTLNRGLVDLNISGAKVNPLIANVGVDFEAINRMDKRKEKSSSALSTPMVSTTSMGKAMGSGSGISRAGMMGMGMNNQPSMGMGLNQQGPMRPPRGPGMAGYTPGMGMGGYGPQQPYGGGYR